MASAMTIPFYLDLGFSKTEIGTIVKLFGFWATIAGGLIGGIVMIRLGINRSIRIDTLQYCPKTYLATTCTCCFRFESFHADSGI